MNAYALLSPPRACSVDAWADEFGRELYDMAKTMTKVKEIKDVSDTSQFMQLMDRKSSAIADETHSNRQFCLWCILLRIYRNTNNTMLKWSTKGTSYKMPSTMWAACSVVKSKQSV